MKKVKRRAITLIEIMIVMFLIAMITGVIAYNYRGSLDEGKAFKTKAGIERLQTILNLRLADDPSAVKDMETGWKKYVEESPLVQNASNLTKDGWGEEYDVNVNQDKGTINITSKKFEEYKRTHRTMFTEDKSKE